MLELLIDTDQQLFKFLNSFHSGFFDLIMTGLSSVWIWIPMYLALIWVIYKKHGSYNAFKIVLAIVLTVIVTDLVTSGLLKPLIGRLRPCHDALLMAEVYNPGKCGGRYSFPSGHAANTMALALGILGLYSRKAGILLIGWSMIVGYSRIYLGVHFPADVIAGFLTGALISILTTGLVKKIL